MHEAQVRMAVAQVDSVHFVMPSTHDYVSAFTKSEARRAKIRTTRENLIVQGNLFWRFFVCFYGVVFIYYLLKNSNNLRLSPFNLPRFTKFESIQYSLIANCKIRKDTLLLILLLNLLRKIEKGSFLEQKCN